MPVQLYTDEDRKRRVEPEKKDEAYRNCWRRDYARLVHSPSFRRLQGKTQLFPGSESDFFRNRLTHSIEVAQIAKSIAARINDMEVLPEEIDLNLVEFAGLAHDLGHPPFGHVGEKALDECMKHKGGFEGNAQTLRILTKLEKKKRSPSNRLGITEDGEDYRLGLNLTYRSLASILKYDNEIARTRDKGRDVEKGYYYMESDVVRNIRNAITGGIRVDDFKTVECQIMDLADDIAYSTYDLEDAFKADFLSPLSLLAAGDQTILDVTKRVSKSIGHKFTEEDTKRTLFSIFKDFIQPGSISDTFFPGADGEMSGLSYEEMSDVVIAIRNDFDKVTLAAVTTMYRSSEEMASNSYKRMAFTSSLVDTFVKGVEVNQVNTEIPALSKVILRGKTRKRVEVLKHFTFVSQIQSPRLKVVEYRGGEIVSKIFETLSSDGGHKLLPMDYKAIYENIDGSLRDRVVCDFIGGMTDRYALEYYARITSENAQTIFKPH